MDKISVKFLPSENQNHIHHFQINGSSFSIYTEDMILPGAVTHLKIEKQHHLIFLGAIRVGGDLTLKGRSLSFLGDVVCGGLGNYSALVGNIVGLGVIELGEDHCVQCPRGAGWFRDGEKQRLSKIKSLFVHGLAKREGFAIKRALIELVDQVINPYYEKKKRDLAQTLKFFRNL